MKWGGSPARHRPEMADSLGQWRSWQRGMQHG
jgi:hypothetical protein